MSQTLQFISQLIFILFIFACLSFWTSQTNIKLSNLWAMPDVSLGLVKRAWGWGGWRGLILAPAYPSMCSVPLRESLRFSEESVSPTEWMPFLALIFQSLSTSLFWLHIYRIEASSFNMFIACPQCFVSSIPWTSGKCSAGNSCLCPQKVVAIQRNPAFLSL